MYVKNPTENAIANIGWEWGIGLTSMHALSLVVTRRGLQKVVLLRRNPPAATRTRGGPPSRRSIVIRQLALLLIVAPETLRRRVHLVERVDRAKEAPREKTGQ